MSLYKDQTSEKTYMTISIQDVKRIDNLGSGEGASKKNTHTMCVRTAQKVDHYFQAEKEKVELWIEQLEKWLSFKHFFGPVKLISRSRVLAHFASAIKDTTTIRFSAKELIKSQSEDILEEPVKKASANDALNSSFVIDELEETEKEKNSAQDIEPLESPPHMEGFLEEKKVWNKVMEEPVEEEDNVESKIMEEELEYSEELEDNFVPFPNKDVPLPEREIVPNREISVIMKTGKKRQMIVDENLDIYELSYMIAEEIGSENCTIMSGKDTGDDREVELLDHQLSLKAQNVPKNATLLIKKTGITDEYMGINDIYDNHFLFVSVSIFHPSIWKTPHYFSLK